jgi:hypothetical protein
MKALAAFTAAFRSAVHLVALLRVSFFGPGSRQP